MNAVVQRPEGRPARQVVEDVIPILDTARFEHMQRIATVMANASLIPESLRTFKDDNNNIVPLAFEHVMANCFLVVNQATKWNMDPFAVAQCVSVVKGKLCYEGKLVAAVLDAKLGIELTFTYNDKAGDALGVVVSGTINGVTKTVEGTVGGWKTSGNNSPWGSVANHKRQLAYRGSREWARLHKPALMLGAYTDDELADLQDASRANRARDVSPPPPPPPADLMTIEAEPATVSETATAGPSPAEAQAADAPPGPPPVEGASAADQTEPGLNPDDELANLIDKLAYAQDEATIEEWYAETDIEAALGEFTGYVEKARQVKAAQLDRVRKIAERNAKAETQADTAAPPPPPALADEDDGEALPPPPADDVGFDVDGWKALTTQAQYAEYAKMISAHATKLGDAAIIEKFFADSAKMRGELLPISTSKAERKVIVDGLNAAIDATRAKGNA